MPWLHVKYNYFEIIAAFVDVRLKSFYFGFRCGYVYNETLK